MDESFDIYRLSSKIQYSNLHGWKQWLLHGNNYKFFNFLWIIILKYVHFLYIFSCTWTICIIFALGLTVFLGSLNCLTRTTVTDFSKFLWVIAILNRNFAGYAWYFLQPKPSDIYFRMCGIPSFRQCIHFAISDQNMNNLAIHKIYL